MTADLALGIDIGTSGVRAAAVTRAGEVVAMASAPMAAPEREGDAARQDPEVWWQASVAALRELAGRLDMARIAAVAVDGTSGTILPVDAAGRALAKASMYNDGSAGEAARRIRDLAPPETAAHGASSPLGRALPYLELAGLARILHQADWIAGRLSDRFDISDENNALKTGYDPVARSWPEFVEAVGLPRRLLPEVRPAGTAVGRVTTAAARDFGFSPETVVIAGTTDGCAAFLATGAEAIGDGVSSLGTTLVLKLLSEKPVFAPQFGIYSHRIGDLWLPGGASNSGGGALAAFFTPEAIEALEPRLRPDAPTGLDLYPLPKRGERFPINDPELEPRVGPRPADDAIFLQALLEGVAGVEALGYRRLAELGGPALRSVRTVGGGARNAAFTAIRARILGVPFAPAASEHAAVGTARLAWRGIA